jgi:hypothetical protein
VLNVHHYHAMQDAPHEHEARIVACWQQIAARYVDHSGRLYVELLTEPRSAMTAQVWNRLLLKGLATVRKSHPTVW